MSYVYYYMCLKELKAMKDREHMADMKRAAEAVQKSYLQESCFGLNFPN